MVRFFLAIKWYNNDDDHKLMIITTTTTKTTSLVLQSSFVFSSIGRFHVVGRIETHSSVFAALAPALLVFVFQFLKHITCNWPKNEWERHNTFSSAGQ